MEGTTHFIEVYKTDVRTVNSSVLLINDKEHFLSLNKNWKIETLAVWNIKLKPKPTPKYSVIQYASHA